MAAVYIICIFAFQIPGLNNGGAVGALVSRRFVLFLGFFHGAMVMMWLSDLKDES